MGCDFPGDYFRNSLWDSVNLSNIPFRKSSMDSFQNYARNLVLKLIKGSVRNSSGDFLRNPSRDLLRNFSSTSLRFGYFFQKFPKNLSKNFFINSFWHSARDYFESFSKDKFRKSFTNFFADSFRFFLLQVFF